MGCAAGCGIRALWAGAGPDRRPRQAGLSKAAPGVVEDVFPERKASESFDVVPMLSVDNKFDWAKEVTFHHDLWTLQFKFKPVRMIWWMCRQPMDGSYSRKLARYIPASKLGWAFK